MEQKCCHLAVDLEGRFEHIRTKETNLGNMLADLFRTEWSDTDFCLLNSGCMRSNMVIPAGELSKKDIAQLLPMRDHIV